jgi:hypothetical protein
LAPSYFIISNSWLFYLCYESPFVWWILCWYVTLFLYVLCGVFWGLKVSENLNVSYKCFLCTWD